MKRVNILTKGRIPWLNREGPLYGIDIGDTLYLLLSRNPRIEIELVTSKIQDPQPVYEYKEPEPEEPIITEYDDMLNKELAKSREIEDKIAAFESAQNNEIELTPEDEEIDRILAENRVNEEPEEIIEESSGDTTPDIIDDINDIDNIEVNEEPIVDESEMTDDYTVDEEPEHDVDIDYVSEAEDMVTDPVADTNIDTKNLTDDELMNYSKTELANILAARGYTEGKYAAKFKDSKSILIKKIRETE